MTDSEAESIGEVQEVRSRAELQKNGPQHVVTAQLAVDVECECGNSVTVGTIQRTVICQECGTEWRLASR